MSIIPWLLTVAVPFAASVAVVLLFVATLTWADAPEQRRWNAASRAERIAELEAWHAAYDAAAAKGELALELFMLHDGVHEFEEDILRIVGTHEVTGRPLSDSEREFWIDNDGVARWRVPDPDDEFVGV